jgi:dolichyl-diphosphooligosaccharide--protein glycosyltransferase
MDLQMLVWVFPAGVLLCFRELRDEHVFVIIYAVVASYFAGVMVRLMLTLTPVVCVAAAIALSSVFNTYVDAQEPSPPDDAQSASQEVTVPPNLDTAASSALPTPSTPSTPSRKSKKAAAAQAHTTVLNELVAGAKSSKKGEAPKTVGIYGLDTRLAVIFNMIFLLTFFVYHCTWVTANAYSSPSVVLASHGPDGRMAIIDDYREAYYWLRQNTPETAVVMSWWDYGYQIAGMANRTTLVDNNTWNNSMSLYPVCVPADDFLCPSAHIATVGKAMSSSEEIAYPILRKHDVDYVLIIFGGLIGYSGDDINKFLWMIRIAQGVWPEEISEPDYFTTQGDYKVDDAASPAMKNSLMYKMSYYRWVGRRLIVPSRRAPSFLIYYFALRFSELFGGGQAVDRVRNQQVPKVGPTLDYLGVLNSAFDHRVTHVIRDPSRTNR